MLSSFRDIPNKRLAGPLYTLRTLLATEALLLLTSAIYGVMEPAALVYMMSGVDVTMSVIPWLCSLVASIALLQVTLVDDLRRPAFRSLTHARLLGDLLLVMGAVLHGFTSMRLLSVIALTLVFSATRVYALILIDEPIEDLDDADASLVGEHT